MYSNTTISFSIFIPKKNDRWNRSGMSETELANWYARYLPVAIRSLREIYKGCKIIIYHNQILYSCFYGGVLQELQKRGIVKLIPVYNDAPPMCEAMLWRLKAIWDAETEYVFIRDVDYLPIPKERIMIDEYMYYGKLLHTISDNKEHNVEMLGGLVGFNRIEFLKEINKSWEELINASKINFEEIGSDQTFYNEYLWSVFKDNSVCHRLYWQPDQRNGIEISEIKNIVFDDVDYEIYDKIEQPRIGLAYGKVEQVLSVFKDKEMDDIENYFNCNITCRDKNKKRVIFSITENTDYSFYAPLTSMAWIRSGFVPVVIVVGSFGEWCSDAKKQYVIDKCIEVGAEIQFIPRMEGLPDATIAQVARAYPYMFGYNDENYFLTADADMIPMSKIWFADVDYSKELHLFFAEAYGYSKYPMCYIGAKVKTWKEITGIEMQEQLKIDNVFDKKGMDLWCYDEDMLGKKINVWRNDVNTQMIVRGRELSDMPKGRVDRGNWLFDKERTDYIDCHGLRPAQDGCNWDRINELMISLLPEKKEWLHEYRTKFINL